MTPQLTLIAGPCAMENFEIADQIASHIKACIKDWPIHFIFKASFKKANRTSLDSFTGIGDTEALQLIKAIGEKHGVETITDIHESKDAPLAAQYVDHLQIPAFLCRQTELLLAAGYTGCGVNIKKGQFLSPESMEFALNKVRSTGNNRVWLCERGTTFGYQDLVVDATAVARMASFGVPIIMDCTHATQRPNQQDGITGGDPKLITTLALSALSTGAAGLFIETHPNPTTAQSDPHTMLQLNELESLLNKAMKIWTVAQEINA